MILACILYHDGCFEPIIMILSCRVVLTTATPLSGVLTHPSIYKVPIRWYNLSLIYIGWIPGPDFGALGMCSSHWKVVKSVMQPRTLGNGPFGGICDLLHTHKDELSQGKPP